MITHYFFGVIKHMVLDNIFTVPPREDYLPQGDIIHLIAKPPIGYKAINGLFV